MLLDDHDRAARLRIVGGELSRQVCVRNSNIAEQGGPVVTTRSGRSLADTVESRALTCHSYETTQAVTRRRERQLKCCHATRREQAQ